MALTGNGIAIDMTCLLLWYSSLAVKQGFVPAAEKHLIGLGIVECSKWPPPKGDVRFELKWL